MAPYNKDSSVIIYQCKRAPHLFLTSELRLPKVIMLWEIITPRSEYGLLIKNLNLKKKEKILVWLKFCEEQRLEIDKYAANESLYMLQNVIKQYINSKKKEK